MLNKEQAYYLLQKLMDGKASSSERATLSQLLQQNHPQEQWIELMEELYHVQSQTEQPVYNEAEWKPVLEQLLQNVRAHNPKVIPMWKRIAIAASIIATIGIAAYVISTRNEEKSQTPTVATTHDVQAPDKNRAQIKLSDGTIVYLDSAGNGTLATSGNVTVVKNEQGEIVYNGTAEVVEYNTMFNPRGSKVQPLTLSDGTKVWLNAESSITYPTAFAGNERKVNITGEAYFEVAHDANKKFIVASNAVNTEVLGTHFNVNSYSDEGDIKVTLLEGSVKIASTSSRNDVVIKPGQQAQVSSTIKVVNGVDVEQVMAWKNGLFKYDNTNIETILRQVGRWYDVEVIYQVKTDELNFSGVVGRKENVSQILKIMELTGLVRFEIDGKKIVVMK